jgi:hypothetical protein
MKKTILSLLGLLLAITACKQTNSSELETLVAPSQLDVESLLDSLDLDMDISQLSVADLRILRHVFAARRGYPFRDSYLRSVYLTTSWYDSLMWTFDGNSENFHSLQNEDEQLLSWRAQYYKGIRPEVMTLTPEQQAFVDRVKNREEELIKRNFETDGDRLVNVGNIINPGLLKPFAPKLQQHLSRYGFAIVPAQHQQLFHVYEQNDYHQFPSFVTTDLFLQLYHLYFDAMLRDIEEHKFYDLLGLFCQETRQTLNRVVVAGNDSLHAKEWLDTYLAVALALHQEKEPTGNEAALHEYWQVMASENDLSEFLGYTDVKFEYSLFRPRGHYTRSDILKRYFRTMMWLQTVPFQTDRRQEMERAVLLAQTIGGSKRLVSLYKRLTQPMDWLMGLPDDVSILQVWEIQKTASSFQDLCRKVDALADKQTRLRPKFQHTSHNKVRFMPQRYQPDAEVLQEMVDYTTTPTKRPVPTGLDVMAAMGVGSAEKILMEELNEPKRWDGYKPMLKKMQQRMDSVNWDENVCNVWLSALKEAASPYTSGGGDNGVPYFMLTPQWNKKSLNAALASWAELKHDAILYAKQPMGAECGGGGPPDPVVKGYVEPNVKFWQRAITLLESTATLLKSYDLATERSEYITTRIKEMAEFLLRVSNYELNDNEISDEEYDQLKAIGATFENMSLELISSPDNYLWEWGAVQGPERNVALIADVYTANADNNPEKSILYEGVGQADELYVVVEIKGYLYLMRGAVFSYRELTRPYGEQRMNDEEWQKKLETNPRLGVPAWMDEITLPLEEAPVDNEEVFYSSGC